jgi:hypothetical protein
MKKSSHRDRAKTKNGGRLKVSSVDPAARRQFLASSGVVPSAPVLTFREWLNIGPSKGQALGTPTCSSQTLYLRTRKLRRCTGVGSSLICS